MTSEIEGPAFKKITGWNEMLQAIRNIFAPEADIEMSSVSFRERRKCLIEEMASYLTAKTQATQTILTLPS